MEWIQEEFGTIDCKDVRRNARFFHLATAWWTHLAASVAAVCQQGWAETMAAYRLVKSKYVTLAVILAPHQTMTLRRVQAEPVVLAIQDTTELDYTGKPIARQTQASEGVGPLSPKRVGCLAHVQYVVTPDRRPLGVWRVTMLVRTVLQGITRTQAHRRKPLEDKESVRWRDGYRDACALATQAPTTKVVSVADREGDLYEIYAEAAAATGTADWVIRACQDRMVHLVGQQRAVRLKLLLGLSPRRALVTLEVPAVPGRCARQAVCARYALTVTLRPPHRVGQKLSPVTVHVVNVRELAPPSGEDRIDWVLLTSLSINTLPDIRRVIAYYAARWEIEVFFRILKTGCHVEQLQLHTRSRLLACLGLCLVLAWRLHWLARLGQLTPTVPCSVAFAPEEWHVIAMLATGDAAPAVAPPLGTVVRWLAQLGGFLGRTGDGTPGAEVLWRGWLRVQAAITLYSLLQSEMRQPDARSPQVC